jgi:HAD superfamily hydrolase (TIGR01490 family)
MQNRHIGAFFDFDETLLEVESARLGFKFLWEQHLVSFGFILRVLIANFFYKRHLVTDERMAAIMIRFYRKKRLDEFAKGAPWFYQEYLKPHLAPNILAKVQKHKSNGHIIVLISGSVRYMLEPVAEDLGFDHLLCTELEIGTDGLLTGNSDGPLCLDHTKKILAENIAKEIGIDLSQSFAYGNHQSDLPLLELVGKPHVVEPTNLLRKIAEERQWPILQFRL